MQLPKRRSQTLKTREEEEGSDLLTPEGLQRLKDTLYDLEKIQQPRAIEDVSVAVAKGDLSENAEYQEARSRLSRIQSRVFTIKDRLKRVQVFEKPDQATGRISLGSAVVLRVNGQIRTYEIVGPRETNPSRGRISHVSPLGVALLGHSAGDDVTVTTDQGSTAYHVDEVK